MIYVNVIVEMVLVCLCACMHQCVCMSCVWVEFTEESQLSISELADTMSYYCTGTGIALAGCKERGRRHNH